MIDLTTVPEWSALADHYREVADIHLRDLFANHPNRADVMTVEAGDLIIDYSKNRITAKTIELLANLADRADLTKRVSTMFNGDRINNTEDKPVLHTALRAPKDTVVEADGHNVVPDIQDVLRRAGTFAEAIRSAEWLGHTGQRIRSVVNIGIGGSDLGPGMTYEALRSFRHPEIECHFISNIDASDLTMTVSDLDPATTLFVISSKTFTTVETMTNAESARSWLLKGFGGDSSAVAKHFVAVSSNIDEAKKFGIHPENIFGLWDWVGGRYSVDSAIGLSLMIAIGTKAFGDMLSGFRTIDNHFRTAPFNRNAPILLALLGVWYRNFFNWNTYAVLPYATDLRSLPTYLQQLDMESNGKQTRLDGTPVTGMTGPIIWGEQGTNGQHAFYQLLHQGTSIVPADFIAVLDPQDTIVSDNGGDQQDFLIANCFAQTKALAFGKTESEVRAENAAEAFVAHKTFPGNRPTNTIIVPALTPSILGQLIALYEHKVFTQGVIWQINSFDQWGVELGKQLASSIRTELISAQPPLLNHDSSTNSLIRTYRAARGR